jgi:hypothetical protein
MIARKSECFHRPISGRPVRPSAALPIGNARHQARSRLGRIAPEALGELNIPKMVQVARSETIRLHVLPIAAGVVIVGGVKGLVHVSDEMQDEFQGKKPLGGGGSPIL